MDPVFIVGCQRSGTTFLGSLLGADPETIAIPEAQFVADEAPDDADTPVDLAATVKRIEQHYRFGIWNFELGNNYPSGQGSYGDAVRWLVRHYAATQGKPDPTRWIDHQPGHVREMDRLLAHFPTLKAIHIVRDGRAVAASIMPLLWGPNAIQSAANFWAQRVAMGMALQNFLPEGCWTQVRYEDLVADSERELRRLCDFIGIRYDPAMQRGQGFAVPAFTQDQHALVGRAPDASRLDSWRKSLSAREIEMFEALVGPLLTYHGYRREFGPQPKLPTFAEKLGMTLSDQWKAIRNSRRFRKRVEEFTN